MPFSLSPLAPSTPDTSRTADGGWRSRVAPFRSSDRARGAFQLASTAAALVGTWALAYAALQVSPLLALVADLALAGVVVRLFIIQHDCGHESFFASERANRIVGTLTSVVLLTPYVPWRRDHAIHHATTGDLEKRGTGDIHTWTVEEFQAATRWQRFGYRVIRNPWVILVAGPVAVFVVGHRAPAAFSPGLARADRQSVHVTTIASLGLWLIIAGTLGWQALVFVHLPAMWMAGSAGVFLFYAQHQLPRPYWRRSESWSYEAACLEGSSHLKLNRILAWFSGDIGLHHLHHLAPRIPNYKLRACLAAHPELAARTTFTLREAWGTLKLNLYDEDTGEMVAFRDVALPATAL